MNPLNNRWVALLVVAGVLLMVAELVGTREHGGVLSRTAQSLAPREQAPPQAPEAPQIETVSEAPIVIEEVPEEDLPQLVTEDDVDDSDSFSAVDAVSGPEMPGESFADDFLGDE